MNKIKILFLTDQYEGVTPGGGAGVYLFELLRSLSKNKNLEIHIFTFGDKNCNEVYSNNIIVHKTKIISYKGFFIFSWNYKIINSINKIIRRENIDILHSNIVNSSLIPRVQNFPNIITIHHPLKKETPHLGVLQNFFKNLNLILEKIILKKAYKIILVSSLTKKLILEEYSFLKNKIVYIPEGVDCNFFKFKKNNIRDKYNIQNNEILLFFPGGARAKRKGANVTFKSLVKLKETGIKFKCFISGDSREIGWKKEFYSLINKNNLSNELILLGELDYNELPKYYSASDIVVFPSLFEGFGIPILESMACRKPIIASKTGEAPNIIKNGDNGFLIKVGDSKDLFNKIKILGEDKNLRLSLGIKGEQLVKSKYSWDKIGNKYIKVYEEVLREHNKKLEQKKK